MLKKKEIALVLAEKKIRNNFVEWLDPIIVKECLNAESLLKSLNEKGSQPSLFFCEIALLPENDKVWQAVAVEKHKNIDIIIIIAKTQNELESNEIKLKIGGTIQSFGVGNFVSFIEKPITKKGIDVFLTQLKIDKQTFLMKDLKEKPKISYIKLLGTGADGRVELWKDNENDSLFAMKCIKLDETNEKENRYIEDEVKYLQSVKSPTIIGYYDTCVEKNERIIKMEYAAGGTVLEKLADFSNKGIVFDADTVIDWIAQIAISLYIMNKNEMMHRDIKLENFLLCETKCNLVYK